ncbi:hypothetical protein AAG570_001962 [Ranatra chinensis]|uniref:Uncharacterized protein n=1 Tax=Ranatra chinensis TaxID=642074 RepID=A0ABD0YP02_9HEMI
MLGLVLAGSRRAQAQCPWDHYTGDLQASCICAYNSGQQLSVQCDMVDFPQLLKALDKFGRTAQIDLLYVNNSTVKSLTAGAFRNLKLTNLQLSGCRIRSVAPGAFEGLQATLKNLYLQDNEIEDVPIESLRILRNLTSLDLSKNRITRVPDNAFVTLVNLATLKLSDNNLTLGKDAFNGLRDTLKNLNLKGARQKRVPEAIKGLRTLAFLDMAQNGLRELPGPAGASLFEGLDSLTALNLERNVIQSVGPATFLGVKETLSSLSLLNNLLTEFPTEAISALTELRVLDIGFNLLTELPRDAFYGNPSLTLLALDGNPLYTVPGPAVAHLNATLRGLSLGGKFLHCDCRLRWVAQWIRRGDLQVTSRERNPEFCGSPPRFTERKFYNIEPEELVCSTEPTGIASAVSEDSLEDFIPHDIGVGVGYVELDQPTTTTETTTTTTTKTTTQPSTTKRTTTPKPTTTKTTTEATTRTSTHSTTVNATVPPGRRGSVVMSRSTLPPWSNHHQPTQRPPLVLGHRPAPQEVIVKSAHRQDSSVIIQWDSDTDNILGFRVVYRLFGDKSFKQGPPLEASEREFKIKNVPTQECIVVCVISLEEINVTPESVPYPQCREVRTASSPTNNMDKITIAASAAICGTVVVTVIVFVAASRRRTRKLHTLEGSTGKLGPVGGLPVACCPASSPGPLSSLATLNAFTTHKDWDQVSVYSNRSLSRSRMYHVERQVADDMRSHFSGKTTKPRSIADGQSQHSFSNNSGRYLSGNAFSSGLVNSRPELRQSRQSLAVSDRMSRQHQRRRSRTSRDQHHHSHSTHTLNYCPGDTSDNWTDHDIDIYMARNPTTARGGLVPL